MPIHESLYAAAVFALGLVFGSFANVVIWRFPRGESVVSPASHCPRCDAPIAWHDNLPVVSWMVLRGRCRACGAPISIRYPVVELASGMLWLLAWALWGTSARTVFGIVFFYLLLILAVIDLDTYRLPNKLVALLGGVGALGVLASSASGTPAVPLLDQGALPGGPLGAAMIGAVASAGFALSVALLYALARKREGFGMGDVKLLAVIGVFLGLYGLMVLFVASVIGAVVGIAAALASREGMARKIPFGPFLAGGSVLVAVFGPGIWGWYASLIM